MEVFYCKVSEKGDGDFKSGVDCSERYEAKISRKV